MQLKLYQKIMHIAAILLSVVYLIWRIFFTLPSHQHLISFLVAVLLLISEIFSNVTAFIIIYFRLRFNKKKDNLLDLPTIDENISWPDIDVIIVTHDEDVELLRKTLNAAIKMTPGPGQSVNVVIADDGNRSVVKLLAQEYQATYIDMPEGNHAAKAGNINHALQFLNAPLVAIFDADMIPFQTFLQHSVPYFLKNQLDRQQNSNLKQLGFLQTPQSFYNADIFQYNLLSEKTATNEQDFFSRDVNVLNGSNGAAIFTGSNAVFSRQAIDAAGGIPEETLTEDFELGVRINLAGYISLATVEPESSGVTPMDIKSVVKQRVRWARGVMQSARHLHIFTNRQLPWINRLILINVYLYWWSFARRMLFIMAPILFAIWHVKLVDANFLLLLILWAPGYFLLQYVLGNSTTNIRGERWGEIQETFFAPYLWLPVLSESLGIKQKKFKVTDKNNGQSTRSIFYGIPYFILWLLDLWALIVFNYGKWGSEIMYGAIISFWLLSHLINLTFSVYIALGRQINRKSERFARSVNGLVKTGQDVISSIQTVDISDKGLSFIKSEATALHVGEKITIKLNYGTQKIDFMGIVRVSYDENKYGISIEKITLENQNRLYHIIYNGKNMLLPWEQDSWMTIYDALLLNIRLRLKNIWMKMCSHRKMKER